MSDKPSVSSSFAVKESIFSIQFMCFFRTQARYKKRQKKKKKKVALAGERSDNAFKNRQLVAGFPNMTDQIFSHHYIQ